MSIRLTGTLTNRGSNTASYAITVAFHDSQHIRFAQGSDFHSDVRPGETVALDALGFRTDPPDGWTCEIVAIDRFPGR